MPKSLPTDRKPWPDDAPEGKCWACPDCESWATIGGNAGFHRDTKKHGEPRLVPLRPIGTSGISEPVIRRPRKVLAKKPIGPSSDDFNDFLNTRNDVRNRLLARTANEHTGYEIWRSAWLACEREHGIRKA